MPKKNTFLPLLQYRNQRNKQKLKNSLQSIADYSSLRSIKKYQSIFDDDGFKFSKMMEKKDQQAANLIQKYFSKFESKKKRKNQNGYEKDSKTLNLINLSKSLDLRIKSKPKLIKISPLSKSVAASNLEQKRQRIFKPKKEITKRSLQKDPDNRVNFLKFPIKILDDPYKSRQQLLSRYGILKTEVSKSLQNDLKVNNYDWKRSKNSYLQKIQRSSDSKLGVYHQKSQRFISQPRQDDSKFQRSSMKIKTQDLKKELKNQIKFKNKIKRLSQESKKLKTKFFKQSIYDINPWTNEVNQVELRQTMK